MPEADPLYPPSLPDRAARQVSLVASAAHRRRVAALILALVGFLLIYLGLIVGCVAAIAALIELALAYPVTWFLALLASLASLAMLAFLVKGLAHRPVATEASVVITADEHPRLFGFVEALAADSGAPTPERIRLTPGVNAGMTRGRSALGFLFGRRELLIGLGLVEVLDLRQFKAVLAHEFGHFAQSSTRLGQRAHQATVVLRELVLGRDRFDEQLARLRGSRVAIVRGLARLSTHGIRGLRILLAAVLNRITRLGLAMAREMEFNADRHAVRLCGSDPLIEALWHTQRGALAMNGARAALLELAKHQRFSDDLYAHQRARLASLDERLDERLDAQPAQSAQPAQQAQQAQQPMWAALREPYRGGPEIHFPPGEAPAEVMLYSHPSYSERERNAKQPYLPSEGGAWPSAWSLFAGPQVLRRQLTSMVYAELGFAVAPERQHPASELEARIDDEIKEREQADHYHRFYDNRVIDPGELEGLLTELEGAEDPAALQAQLRTQRSRWRGPSLAAFMADWARVSARLEALAARRKGEDEDGEFELDGERVSVHARPRLQAEAQRARAQQLREAQALDRAAFRWHWLLADQEQRPELVQRYRFLLFVQRYIVALNGHRARVMGLLSAVVVHEYALTTRAPPALLEALATVHAELGSLLTEALAMPIPALRNLEGHTLTQAGLRRYLLAGELIQPHVEGEALREWMTAFMPQAAVIHDRLRTLHYKNLGALLKLHEQIDPPDQST